MIRLEGRQTKTAAAKTLPIGAVSALVELLEAQLVRKRAIERATSQVVTHVFHKDDGRPIRDYYRAWRKACKRAGVPGRIVHDVRRTAARNLVRAGVPEIVARQITGHKTRSIFDRYCITAERDLAEGLAKLAAHRAQVAGAARKVLPFEQGHNSGTIAGRAVGGGLC